MNKLLLISIILTSIITSCRFSKPLICQVVDSEKTTNETNDTISLEKRYKYLRVSKYGIFGTYKQTSKYDINENLVSLTHDRTSTNKGIRDGKQKHKVKRIDYINNVKRKKTLYVFKNKGRGGKRKCYKTVLYDENGKVTSKVKK